MIKCIEKYEVPGDTFYGIEDHKVEVKEKGKFPFNYMAGRKRFQVWRGGCGIGQAHTLDDARGVVYDYAVVRMRQQREALLSEVAVIDASLKRLVHPGGTLDHTRLQDFKVEHYEYEKKDALAEVLTK